MNTKDLPAEMTPSQRATMIAEGRVSAPRFVSDAEAKEWLAIYGEETLSGKFARALATRAALLDAIQTEHSLYHYKNGLDMIDCKPLCNLASRIRKGEK